MAAQINGRLYAIDSDHLNTPRRLTNAQGQVVWQWLITGYGEVAPTTGATGYAFEAPQLGGSSNTSGNVYSEEVNFKLRYPGQVWDEETGLSYNLNRYYDGQAGRYVQSDPIGLEGGWNRFGYVGGNPLGAVDSTGLLENFTFDVSSGILNHENCANCQNSAIPAFSGRGRYMNQSRYENIPGTGPIPVGSYYIVEPYYYRPGSPISPVFFKLFREDGKIDDETFLENGVRRDQFRFHPGTISLGCVTIDKNTQQKQWDRIQHKLLNTKTGIIPGTDIIYYGTIRVR